MFSATKFKYGVQKSETVKKLEALNNGKIIIPKWLIVVGGFILFFSVVLFVLSIIFATIKKPNGLFNESCTTRICEKKLGLVCKNQICSCPEKQFYSDRCQNLSTHGEFCFIDENCRHKEELLVCSVVSRCECTLEMYWDSYLKKCVPRKSYKENCVGDQCKTSLNLNCNSGSCTCQNSSIQYWNGESCLPKKSIKEYCSETYECLDSENTECKNSLCSCAEQQFFKSSESKCVPSLNEFETCVYDDMCLKPMFCSISSGCRCPKYYFYENVTSTCTNQYKIDSQCDKDHHCRHDLGLTCQNGSCLCSAPSYTWSSKSSKCKLTYGKSTCLSDLDCNDSENLICQANDCNCPVTSLIGMCDCSRNLASEQYWSGFSCESAKPYLSSCVSDFHCRTLSQKTFCSPRKMCECPDDSLFYWDGFECKPKISYQNTCSASIQCLDSQLTFCNGSNCVCETTQYFDGSKCTLRFVEFERCFFDDMCLLPMSCESYLCTCGDLFYFENSTMTCLPKLKSGYFCDKNLQCRSDLGLSCLNNECSCDSLDRTWASQVEDCLLTYGKRFCHNDLNCNMDENLICQAQNCSCPQPSVIGMCDCNRTLGNEQFWNGKQCTIASAYGRNCTNNFHCQTLTQKTVCVVGICNCYDLAREYFDGTMCVDKKKISEQCSLTNQCLDNQLTECISGVCSCKQDEYFSPSLAKCVPRVGELESCFFDDMCLMDMVCNDTHCLCVGNKYFENQTSQCTDQHSFNQYCDKDIHCRKDQGLFCSSNRCLCSSVNQAWSPTANKCLLTYGKQFCSPVNLCNSDQNLKCINQGCDCPDISKYGMCDCQHSVGKEEYWNGSYCASANGYSLMCFNDYECQTLTQKTACISGSCLCMNYSIEYWDGSMCQSKKKHLEKCTNPSECLDSQLTDCVSGICFCPLGQYFHEYLQKCVARLMEFENCDNSTMCYEVMSCDPSTNQCLCPTDQYFKNTTLECVNKKWFNLNCDRDWDCSSARGLTCQNNKCECTWPRTWDSNQNDCRLTYAQYCGSNSDCDSSDHLICSNYGNRCHCPSGLTASICDCKRTNADENYWDGSTCVPAKTFREPCTNTYECKTISENLICRNNICQCKFNEVFRTECERICHEDDVYVSGKCYYFSTNSLKGDDVASKGCVYNKIGERVYNGRKDDWKRAMISSAEIRDVLAEYLKSVNNVEAYWIDYRSANEWSHHNEPIDFSICPSAGTSGQIYMNFKIDCFNNDISTNTQLKFICEAI